MPPTVGSKRKPNNLLGGCLVGFHFEPQDGGSAFLRNLSEHLPHYMTSGPEDATCIRDVTGSNLGRGLNYFD
jgi:hypothetical protein